MFEELCRCEECPLNGRVVPGERLGNGPVEVAFVGLYPGMEEIHEGKVNVGRSGQILRGIMEKFGYSNSYMTNVLLCLPKANMSTREESDAVIACRDRLDKEIRGLKPKLVVAMGNLALRTLTGIEKYKITEVSGLILTGDETGNLQIPLLPIEHPASYLRKENTANVRDLVDAFEVAGRWLSGTYCAAESPTAVLVDENNIGEVLQRIENAGTVAIDLETTKNGFYPYGRDPDKIRCMALAIDKRVGYIIPAEPSPHFETHRNVFEEFKDKIAAVVTKTNNIYHNAIFDAGFLWANDVRVPVYYDTMLAHYLLDERSGRKSGKGGKEVKVHGLKTLARKLLGANDWESDIKNFLKPGKSSYDYIPDTNLYWYAAHDVAYTFQLYDEYLRDKITPKQPNQDEHTLSGVFNNILMPCANMFTEIRHRGINVSIPDIMELDSVLDRELDEILDRFEKHASASLNPASVPDVQYLLYEKLGILRPFTDRDGKVKKPTDKIILGPIRDVPVVSDILDYRETTKLRSTYVLGMASFVDYNWKIHPTAKLFGAVTGRISSENPSVMNVIKRGGIKNIYIGNNGSNILEADQKQMELRCYAVIAQDEHLREILAKGGDPHQMVADGLTSLVGGNFSPSFLSRINNDLSQLRYACKSGVFGRLYYRGFQAIKTAYGLTDEEGIAMVSAIDGLFPSVNTYRDRIKKEIHERGYLESYFGRRRRFPVILEENKHEFYRQGSNFEVQSMASDVNLLCMLHVFSLRGPLGVYPLFPVHDSIVFEVENGCNAEEVSKVIRDYSKELVHGAMDFELDLAIGDSWGTTVKLN